MKKEEQKQYNEFVETTSAKEQDKYNGGPGLSSSEEYFIMKYAETSVLDIGCGTANRTFPVYNKSNLKATGIEKFNNLINASNYKDQIVKLDLGDPDFLNHKTFKSNFDLAVCLGGVINGFIDEELRLQAWKNLAGLLYNSSIDSLLVDTFANVSWYDTGEVGKTHRVAPIAPPQYMYSRKELLALFNELKLEVAEESIDSSCGVSIAYYLLKRK